MIPGNSKNFSFAERFQNLAYLLKHSFSIVGRDRDIVEPWIRMVIYSFIQLTLFFGAVFFFAMEQVAVGLGFTGLWFVMLMYLVFYLNYQEIRQSWLVYQTVIGNDRSYQEAVEQSNQLSSEVRWLAIFDIFFIWLSSMKNKDDPGIIGMIINLLIEGLEEVWDLANHYLLPAVAIDKMSLTDGVKSMKRLKDKVPESLMGIFGIDLLGSVVGMIVMPVHLVMFLLASVTGVYAAGIAPSATVMTVSEEFAKQLSFLFGDSRQFTWLPIFLFGMGSATLSMLLKRTVTSVKVIYFTIFYTKITHADRIQPNLQDELGDYLQLKGQQADGQ